ncbi:Cytochrome c oxidase assembly protein COX15 -like protein [Halotydeus destructor]|nr:Cytochrome c oxidase assembly protein COX15 -like protein [Halotydeus destructor]
MLSRLFIQSSSVVRRTRVPLLKLSNDAIALRTLPSRPSATLSKDIAVNLPDSVRKAIGYWLLTCSGFAFSTVVLGGITRLTKSGLSMVDWHLFKEAPPMSREQWEAEFEKYKQFPEFKLKNLDMSLGEFKAIWYMEYMHRSFGRFTGIVFTVPAVVFWARNYFVQSMKKRVLAFGSLILCQGLLGWYMVKSGLEEETAKRYGNDPKVSHYRLAAHLGTAFVLYSLLLWSAFSHLLPPTKVAVTPQMVTFRRLAHGSKALLFFTALSGAFVAGLDAGLIYNTFPKMGNSYVPSEIFDLSPAWKNFAENPTMTQFQHRTLGISTFTLSTITWLYSRKLPLTPRMRLAANVFYAAIMFQVALGISTLLSGVNKPLASTHQAGALTALSTAIWLTHELKLVKYIPK